MPDLVIDRLIPRLIAAPNRAGLSAAELSAAVLDGDLFRLGDAFLPVDLPDDPAARASALLPVLGRHAVVARRSAAWVWGALWRLDEPITSYVRPQRRSAARDPVRAVVHEVLLTPEDVAFPGGVAVTAPLRTAMDLARAVDADFDQQALGRMLGIAGVDAAALIAEIERRPRLPGRRPALRRLQVLFTR